MASLSRLLLGYLVFVGILVALKKLAPEWTVTGTVAACFLVPFVSATHPTRRSLFQPRWKATLQSLYDGGIASLVLLPVFLGVVYFLGEWSPQPLSASSLTEHAVREILAVALPEEFFFRGYLQGELDRVWKRRVRVRGAPCGWGLLLAAALFACSHVLLRGEVRALLVVFPGLIFGWLYARRRSIAGPVIFHAACNLSRLACPGWM